MTEPVTCECGMIAVGKCSICRKWVCGHHSSLNEKVICSNCSVEKQRQITQHRRDMQERYGVLEAIYQLRGKADPSLDSRLFGVEQDIVEYLKPGCAKRWVIFASKNIAPSDYYGNVGWCIGHLNLAVPSHIADPDTNSDGCSYTEKYRLICTEYSRLIYFPLKGKRYASRRVLSPCPVNNAEIDWSSVGRTIKYLLLYVP